MIIAGSSVFRLPRYVISSLAQADAYSGESEFEIRGLELL